MGDNSGVFTLHEEFWTRSPHPEDLSGATKHKMKHTPVWRFAISPLMLSRLRGLRILNIEVCPRCTSRTVRRSHRRFLERFLCVIGLYPFRCIECQGRLWRLIVRCVIGGTETRRAVQTEFTIFNHAEGCGCNSSVCSEFQRRRYYALPLDT